MVNDEPNSEPEFKDITDIRIKIGPIEIEYKGREEFLKNELAGLLVTVLETYKETGIQLNLEDSTTDVGSASEEKAKNGFTFTTGTIASKMGANSGPDLIIAACTHLTLTKNRESFDRKDIIEEMKTATHYFKQSYIGNLTKSLGNLVKSQKLLETSRDKYALTAQTRNAMEQLLAN